VEDSPYERFFNCRLETGSVLDRQGKKKKENSHTSGQVVKYVGSAAARKLQHLKLDRRLKGYVHARGVVPCLYRPSHV
jgi:hypothetical protein